MCARISPAAGSRMIADPKRRRDASSPSCFRLSGRLRRRRERRPRGGRGVHVEAPAPEAGRPRVLRHRRSPFSRLSAVRSAALSAGERSVLLRGRSDAVRLRRAEVLVLRAAPDHRPGRAIWRADLLLHPWAALPLVCAAAAGAVRDARWRLLVRRRLRPGLLQRSATVRGDQRLLYASGLRAAGHRRAHRAARFPRRNLRRWRLARRSRGTRYAHGRPGAPLRTSRDGHARAPRAGDASRAGTPRLGAA